MTYPIQPSSLLFGRVYCSLELADQGMQALCLFNLLAPAPSRSSIDLAPSSLLPTYKSCMVPCLSCLSHHSFPLMSLTCSPTMPPHHSCKLTAPAWTLIDPTSNHTLHQITIVLRVFLSRLAFTQVSSYPIQYIERPYFVAL
jgi:hypothetical protein